MALIKCPECGQQVSDKAAACIHCGYPLDNIQAQNNIIYSIELTKSIKIGKMYSNTMQLVHKIVPDKSPITLVNSIPVILTTGLSKDNAEWLKEEFARIGAILSIHEDTECKQFDNQLNSLVETMRNDSLTVKCPRCGSTAITTGQRGFKITTGFIGSNKTVNRCAKCGYSWQP